MPTLLACIHSLTRLPHTFSRFLLQPPLETAHISRRRALSLKAYDTMSDDEYVEWLKSPYKERAHTKTFSSTMWYV